MLPAQLTLGPLALRVHNIERMYAFYTQALGMTLHAQSDADGSCLLGSEAAVLLHLIPDATAVPAPRNAGLYHVAYLYPTRAALATAIRTYVSTGLKLQGASDHGVSEALYLSDPEGNGIELYVDRPRSAWPSQNGQLTMTTDPLDFPSLLAEPDDAQAPIVGHLHLHVADLAAARTFYVDVIGFDLMQQYGGQAEFVSAGGYHHHLGYNLWRGKNIVPAPDNATGLVWWTVNLPDIDAQNAVIARLVAAKHTHTVQAGVVWVRDSVGIQLRIVVGA
jgi:catechol 2,3-dioxygenase